MRLRADVGLTFDDVLLVPRRSAIRSRKAVDTASQLTPGIRLAIPIVSAQSGLSTFGGSEGVGWATTRAVVNSSLAVIVLNFFISAAGLVLFP